MQKLLFLFVAIFALLFAFDGVSEARIFHGGIRARIAARREVRQQRRAQRQQRGGFLGLFRRVPSKGCAGCR